MKNFLDLIDLSQSYYFFMDHLGWMLLAIFFLSSFTDFGSRHRAGLRF